MEGAIENLLVSAFPVSLQIPPSWLGVDLMAPEAEDMGEVGLNLQCQKKKKKKKSLVAFLFVGFGLF